MRYKGLDIKTSSKVYKPSDDSFLIAEILEREIFEGDKVLEIGTGTGILALIASERAKKVIALDINPEAVKLARENIKINKKANVEIISGNLFENIDETFDAIIFNPPYLPAEDSEQKDGLNTAWDGGKDGRDVIDIFIGQVKGYLNPKGRAIFVQSSLNDRDKTEMMLSKLGFKAETLKEDKFFFERLYVIKAGLKDDPIR